MKTCFFIILIFLCGKLLKSQVLTGEELENIEDLIEEIAQNTDYELDLTILYEDLIELHDNPLNINTITRSQLEKLPFLNEYQVQNLILYLSLHGPLLSVYELQLISGFDMKLIRMLLPFVVVIPSEKEEETSFLKALSRGKHQLFLRSDQILQEQKGYAPITDSAYLASPNSRYLGGPVKLVTRYRYHYKDRIYWGITADKDPGEEFFSGSNKQGFDYYSGYLQVNNIGKIKTFSIGDYHLRFGQGLTLWSGINYGKSPYVLQTKKRQYGITKYSSTDENRFFRGIGTTLSFKNLDLTAFYSKKRIDANQVSNDTLSDENEFITRFQVTGLHSIPTEVEDEDAVTETIIGGNISYGQDKYHLGLTVVNYLFDTELVPDDKPYKYYSFSGDHNMNIGFDYQVALKKFNFYGELSHSLEHGFATLNGLLLNMNSLVSLAVLYRNYQKDYYPFYSNAFAENSTNSNEQGWYIGTEIRPVKHLKVSAYFDLFRFPWLKYNVDVPSDGTDYLVRFDYTPSDKVEMYLSLKEESKPRNKLVDYPSLNEIEDTDLLKLRYHLSYWVSSNIQLRSRIELSRFKRGESPVDKGYMLYQDILFRPGDLPLSVSFRYALFDTDSYDSRIFVYEHDILYAYSVPFFHYSGTRTYFLIKYSPVENVDLWFRLSNTSYSNRDVTGSGLNEIDGSNRTDVKAQVQFRF